MNVLQGFQASPTEVTFDDIEMCGDTLENPTKGAADVDITSITLGEPLLFPLNETGKGWVNKTGYTKLCVREGHDIENVETVNNDNYWRESGISYYTSEKEGVEFDPYLEITYEVSDEEQDVFELLHALIAAVEANSFDREIEQSYMAHLGKIEAFLNSAHYTPSENQLYAFIKKLKRDYVLGNISNTVYEDLLERANAVLAAIPNDAFGTVPLMTQVVSPYPSVTDTTSWAGVTFADGRGTTNPNDYCGLTIEECGCAITSLSMLGQHYGIQTGFDGSSVNPLNMDNWLLNGGDKNGYDAAGNMLWSSGLAYLSQDKNGKYLSHLSIKNAAATAASEISQFVEAEGPALGFSYLPYHWLVLEGLTDTGYTVKDPYWYNTKTTNDTKDALGKVRDYNDALKKAVLISYNATPKPLSKMVEFYLNSPAELTITDGEGRRVGYDAEHGEYVSEIEGGTYDPEVAIVDQGDSSLTPHFSKHLMLIEPAGDVFELEVTGTGEGSYSVTSGISDGLGNLEGGVIADTTATGEMHHYTIATRLDTDALPAYLSDILNLIPQSEHKKFIQAFKVVFAQTEKNHVAITETLVQNLSTYIARMYKDTSWVNAVIDALSTL